MNSSFAIEQGKLLAARLDQEAVGAPHQRVAALYHFVFAREPSDLELNAALEFVQQPIEAGSQLSVWEQIAQVLLASNELMYLD